MTTPTTFAEFLATHEIPLRQYAGRVGAYLVLCSDVPTPEAAYTLFHLDDFLVLGSVSGPGWVLCDKARVESLRKDT